MENVWISFWKKKQSGKNYKFRGMRMREEWKKRRKGTGAKKIGFPLGGGVRCSFHGIYSARHARAPRNFSRVLSRKQGKRGFSDSNERCVSHK